MSLTTWWERRTTWAHGKVTLIAAETSFAWGLVRVYRYRAYHVENVDEITMDTPYHTWRMVHVGPLSVTFRYPRFVEDRLD